MGKANLNQINIFKERYCYNETSREKIINDFSVDIETYEELLPGNTVKSYATGNRDFDFELLRNKMMAKYPKEHIVF